MTQPTAYSRAVVEKLCAYSLAYVLGMHEHMIKPEPSVKQYFSNLQWLMKLYQ